jgi:hypothetical protein
MELALAARDIEKKVIKIALRFICLPVYTS